MAVDPLDPTAAVRRRVVAGVQQDDMAPTPVAPVSPVPVPAQLPGIVGPKPMQAQAQPDAPTLPSGPAPGQYTPQSTAAPVAAAPAPQAGQFANSNQGFLDWATQKYGADPTRGGGFVNAAAGGGLEKMLGDYAAATGNQAKFLGGPSGDRVDFGQGVQDALTSGGQIWNAAGGGGNARAGGGGAAGGAGGAGAAGSGNAWTDSIRKMLMERMKKDTLPVDETDAYIQDPMNAARLEANRTSDVERRDLAERAYASGDLGGDTIRQGIMQSHERNAVGLGSMRAKLIQQEYQARRADLDGAMQQALASGDAQTAHELQQALANLDAQLRREGYGIQMAQFAQGQNTNTVNSAKGPGG